jgi:AcrR family transcriptional regulator
MIPTLKAKRETAVRSAIKPLVRRRQADRTALSDKLLTEAAIELLVKSGIHGTTLQAVGERAGYSRALATHRFGSKAGLFSHVLKTASADWLARMKRAVGARVGIDALCAVTDATEKFLRERPDEVRALYLLWFQSIDPGADPAFDVVPLRPMHVRKVRVVLRAGQQSGQIDLSVNPRRVAEQYCATMAGIAYQWLATADMPLGAMYRQLKSDLRARLRTVPAARRARALRIPRRA